MQTPPIEVKEFFATRRSVKALYGQYGGLTIYRSINIKNEDELLFLVAPTKGLRPLLKKRASCKSPYLARILEIGTIPETSHPYWVCALDLGSKFDELLNDLYKPARICRLLRQAAIGLMVLHNNDVYHGDVRAGNIWVRINGHEEEAFWVGVSIDQWANIIGNPVPSLEQARYMAPERTMGEPSSKSSDIYAFGVLVYRALSGSYPFDGTEPFSISASHATEPVPVPLNPFDEPLWALLLQALEKDPAKRLNSLNAFIEVLGKYEFGQSAVQLEELEALSSEEEPTPAFSIPISPTSESQSGETPSAISEDVVSVPPRDERGMPIDEEYPFSDEYLFVSDDEKNISQERENTTNEPESLAIPQQISPPPAEITDWSFQNKAETTQNVQIPPPQESPREEAENNILSEIVEHHELDIEFVPPTPILGGDLVEEELLPIQEADVSESEHTKTEELRGLDDMDSETIYTVDESMSEDSQLYSDLEPDTLEHTEGSEDITVVPIRVQVPNTSIPKEDLAVPNISIVVVNPQEDPEPPKIHLDDISPLAKADITENDAEQEEQEFTGSIQVDFKKYILIFLVCFTSTILIMYLFSS